MSPSGEGGWGERRRFAQVRSVRQLYAMFAQSDLVSIPNFPELCRKLAEDFLSVRSIVAIQGFNRLRSGGYQRD